MTTLISFCVFFFFLGITTLFFEHTRLGRRIMRQFDKWFVKSYIAQNPSDTTVSLFDYDVAGYRLYCKNDHESMIYTFKTEGEVANFISLYKKTYRGRIVRLEKIMRAR